MWERTRRHGARGQADKASGGATRKVGVLGGTFDPIHCGHILMAQGAKRIVALDEVRFIPVGSPPHKSRLAEAAQRVAMIEKAIAPYKDFVLDLMEINRCGVTYTVDTLRALTQASADDIYFIVGSDTLLEMHTWKDTASCVALAHFIVVPRSGYDAAAVKAEMERLTREMGASLLLAPLEVPGISSTLIRESVEVGAPLTALVPPDVARYIEEHGLYRE